MKNFMDENFLLQGKTAQNLYHNYAKKMEIYDYHCHLSAAEIWQNKSYANLSELWLGGDHYKWRLMRAMGFDESLITGQADPKQKFIAFSKTVEQSIGNPIYHWSHLELQRYFAIDLPICEKNADAIWEKANALLKQDDFKARALIERSNLYSLCTTDDPIDSLEYHQKIKMETTFKVHVLPTFRPDKAIYLQNNTFIPWLAKLETISGSPIISFDTLKKALINRIDFFHSMGCRISDHALDPVLYTKATDDEADKAFMKAKQGETLSYQEIQAYQSQLIFFLGNQYHRRHWVMQLHLGVNRNNNRAMFEKLGPDTGFDAIGDNLFSKDLTRLLDALNSAGSLPKTIFYSLNERENMVLSTLAGCFQGEGKSKIQFGSAWWFNDHLRGMEKQLTDLAQSGVLGNFIGMLTDSRSFISYPRHEYFRRILCNLIGMWADEGQLFYDDTVIGTMVENICFNNIKTYIEH